jgi:hypothetical protein
MKKPDKFFYRAFLFVSKSNFDYHICF